MALSLINQPLGSRNHPQAASPFKWTVQNIDGIKIDAKEISSPEKIYLRYSLPANIPHCNDTDYNIKGLSQRFKLLNLFHFCYSH